MSLSEYVAVGASVGVFAYLAYQYWLERKEQ